MNPTNVDQHGQNKYGKLMMEPLMHNMKSIETAITIMFIIGGIICGILGFTGVQGLGMFVLVSIVWSFSLLVKMNFQQRKYTDLSVLQVFTMGMSNHSMSFVLFWTLAYALVHIY